MKNRIKQLCSALGCSQQELAEKLMIDVRKLRSYVYETKNLPAEFLCALALKLNVNINWLLTGNGAMFIFDAENTLEKKESISCAPDLSITAERVKLIQEKNSLADKDMAKLLGIYEDDYKNLKNCYVDINLRILCRLKQNFKVSFEWLLAGFE